MPKGSRYFPIQPFSANTVVRAMPETAVGSANGMSMSASMSLRPGNSYLTSVQAMMNPNTRLIEAARKEAPNDRRYDPMALGLNTRRTKSCQVIEVAMSTRAASGISTMAHRKNVVNPNVSPKPGNTLGCLRLTGSTRPARDAR